MPREFASQFSLIYKGICASIPRVLESGEETDPFLLILTPDKKLGFLKTYRADKDLLGYLSQWSAIDTGKSIDYRMLVTYSRVGWEAADNFSLRKVVDYEGVDLARVHEWLVYALENDCSLAEVPDDAIAAIVGKCIGVQELATNEEVSIPERVAALGELIAIGDAESLAEELVNDPIGRSVITSDEEAEEAIETAGALAPVELMSIIGSKGLSARHVMIPGLWG